MCTIRRIEIEEYSGNQKFLHLRDQTCIQSLAKLCKDGINNWILFFSCLSRNSPPTARRAKGFFLNNTILQVKQRINKIPCENKK